MERPRASSVPPKPKSVFLTHPSLSFTHSPLVSVLPPILHQTDFQEEQHPTANSNANKNVNRNFNRKYSITQFSHESPILTNFKKDPHSSTPCSVNNIQISKSNIPNDFRDNSASKDKHNSIQPSKNQHSSAPCGNNISNDFRENLASKKNHNNIQPYKKPCSNSPNDFREYSALKDIQNNLQPSESNISNTFQEDATTYLIDRFSSPILSDNPPSPRELGHSHSEVCSTIFILC